LAKANQGIVNPARPAKAGGNSWLQFKMLINSQYIGKKYFKWSAIDFMNCHWLQSVD